MPSNRCAAATLLLLAGCAGAPRLPGGGGPGPDGDERLAAGVVPLGYSLQLDVDPARATFEGEVAIRLRLDAPTRELRLHATRLEVREAVAYTPAGARTASARPGPNGGLGLSFDEPLPEGEIVLELRYAGPIAEDLFGLYRSRSRDQWIAVTQLEPLGARQVLPCFDEPRFKTPFVLTLRVPHGVAALSNAPVAETRQEGDRDVVRFRPTPPLPTYLLALAVGRFDVRDAGVVDGVPVRILAAEGKGALTAHAAARVGPILEALSGYFGRPYPYEKLDLIAVPDFGYGAMENPGLVTFREPVLLLDASRASGADRLRHDAYVAHELAHQWFGNLVTMAWWDDVWLNEGMASWAGTKAVQRVAPELGIERMTIRDAGDIMLADALEAARSVRQPIRDGGDVLNAFDDITYGKGELVLRMLEAWAGEAAFREGVRAYVNAHAWGNATASDLFAALDGATGKPLGAVAATFLDQPGTPLLAVEVACGAGPAKVKLAQRRYLPEGSRAGPGQPWRMPVCLRYELDGVVSRQCTLLEAASAEVTLERPGCPAWLHPNADERGYYRWELPPAQLQALLAAGARLSEPEAIALPGHLEALLVADRLAPDAYLAALEPLARSDERTVLESVVAGLRRVHHATAGAGAGVGVDADAYAHLVRDLLGEKARALGLVPRPGENPDAQLLRPALLPAVAELGRDAELRREAAGLARRWLAEPASVPLAAAQIAVPIAALDGDAALHDALVAALAKAEDPADRSVLLLGLGSFRDPALLARSLELSLTDSVRAGELWRLVWATTDDERADEVTLGWLAGNFPAIAAKVGEEHTGGLAWSAVGLCRPEQRRRVEAFFAEPSHTRPGTARNVAQVSELVDRCVRLRARAGGPVQAFLERRASAPGAPPPAAPAAP